MSEAIGVPVITLDGPSGTGKGTLCHRLAKHLGWHFLDSGALYRILAYAAKKAGIHYTDEPSLVALARGLALRFDTDATHLPCIFLGDEEVATKIRTEECGQDASKIAVLADVREALLNRQRVFAQFPGLVTDGRDMGTVVFPDAFLKIYLDASLEERAKRRYLQLKQNANDVSLAQVMEELIQRDARDTARLHAPLKPADDAVRIDTTGLEIDQVFYSVLELIYGGGTLNTSKI